MRLKLSLTVLGILVGAALPAQAQQAQMPAGYNAGYQYQAQTTASSPFYNSGTGVQPYYGGQQNTSSYNSNAVSPYSFNGGYNSNPMTGVTSIGAMTPEQAAYVRAQRDAAAQAYQQQYFGSLQQQVPGGATNQVGAYNQMNPFYPGQDQKKPTKRRVVYNQKNNPLSAPPRLFNPDQ